MATGRKLISDIRGRVKLLSGDNRINDRVMLSQIRSSALLLIKRETNLRKLWATDTIFTPIPCLEMKEVSISECSSYVDECTIARSVYKLPRMTEGNYQYVIQGVYSINAMGGNGKKIKEISLNRYLNLLKLPIIKKEEYFWISNSYLYITNPLLKAVRIVALFEEDIPNEILYPVCGCGISPSLEERCMNPLDRKFPLPGYLEKQVMDLVTEELLKTYFNVKTDVSEEGLDGQASNMTESR